jgi:multicomponent Na+:H+ antiporter subunit B
VLFDSEEDDGVRQSSRSLIVVLVSRVGACLIQIFALYVIFHGHYSPGGGFQGGALLAASIFLLRMSSGHKGSQTYFRSDLGLTLGAAGALAFLVMGLITTIGGNFLEYRHLPLLALEPAQMRSLGILIVEMAIAVGVMGTLIFIFDNLNGREVDG